MELSDHFSGFQRDVVDEDVGTVRTAVGLVPVAKLDLLTKVLLQVEGAINELLGPTVVAIANLVTEFYEEGQDLVTTDNVLRRAIPI